MVTNDVLQTELRAVAQQLNKLDVRFDSFANQYTRSDVLELKFKELETQIASVNLKIVELEKGIGKSSWKSHTLTAIFTAIVIFLATYVATDILRK